MLSPRLSAISTGSSLGVTASKISIFKLLFRPLVTHRPAAPTDIALLLIVIT